MNSEHLTRSADQLFIEAREGFFSSLSTIEISQFGNCSSVKEVLDGIRNLKHPIKDKRRIYQALDQIKAFGDNLEPYFKIIEIFCGSHPEWSNLALGALRLILQLSSQFVTFFEKLCNAVHRLSLSLPRFGELYEALTSNPGKFRPRLEASLKELYLQLFNFFEAVARVFSNRFGKIRRTPQVIASLMWTPFEVRFGEIMTNIKSLESVVNDELIFACMGSLKSDIGGEADKANQRQKEVLDRVSKLQDSYVERSSEIVIKSITLWLDPPDYTAKFEQAQQEKAAGTTEWLFDNPVFQEWKNDDSELHGQENSHSPAPLSTPLIWVNGNPGSGKTVLAASTIGELSCPTSNQVDFPPEVCYYFFSQTSTSNNSKRDCYKALASQIFHHFHRLEKVYNLFSLAADRMATKINASENEVLETISQCLPHLPNIYFVLDGVDECEDQEKLVKQLDEWSSTHRLKVLVFSRPDVAKLRRTIPEQNRIQLNRTVLDSDIVMYLKPEIGSLLEERLLPECSNTDIIMDHLLDRAEGMFLWVRLMVRFLSSPAMTKSQRLQTIMESDTEGLDRLDEMYCRIQARITSTDPYSRELAHKALMWVAYSTYPISSFALQDAICPDGWDDDVDESTESFDHAVIVACSGLVEKNTHGDFRYIHLTALRFTQFSSTRTRSLTPLIPNESASKSLLASRCISYLCHQLPCKPLSGQMGISISFAALNNQWPLLDLASKAWILWCTEAIGSAHKSGISVELTSMISLAEDYLRMRVNLLVWLEVVYTCRQSMVWWKNYAKIIKTSCQLCIDLRAKALLSNLYQLIYDLSIIDSNWGRSLHSNPSEIWGDVTIFAKSRFFASTKAGSLEELAPHLQTATEEDELQSICPTFTHTVCSSTGDRVAILSIFPSNLFRNGWETKSIIPLGEDVDCNYHQDRPPRHSPHEPDRSSTLEKTSSGWLAKYEVLEVHDTMSQRVVSFSIPLESEDVRLCLYQSLFKTPLGPWKCSFPLSIAPGQETFTVLNKIFHFSLRDKESYRTTTIPLDFDQRFKLAWSSDCFVEKFMSNYSYRIVWSPDSKRFAFVDSQGPNVFNERATCLAIFENFNFSDPKPPKLIQSTFQPEPFSESLADYQFHPNPIENLFLFRADSEVYLWPIDGLCKPKLAHTLPGFITVEKVTFSHCGTSIHIFYPKQQWPTVVDLSSKHDFNHSRKHLLAEEDVSPSGKKAKKIQPRNESAMESDIVLSQATAYTPMGSSMMPFNSTQRSTFVSVAEHHGPEISILHMNGDEKHRISVLRLPQDIPIHSTTTVISIPSGSSARQRDELKTCRILVATNQPNRFVSDEPGRPPFVVRKDMRSLQIPSSILHRLEQPPDTAAHSSRELLYAPDEPAT